MVEISRIPSSHGVTGRVSGTMASNLVHLDDIAWTSMVCVIWHGYGRGICFRRDIGRFFVGGRLWFGPALQKVVDFDLEIISLPGFSNQLGRPNQNVLQPCLLLKRLRFHQLAITL